MPVPKQPPPAVPELPPDEQPQGKDVQWMPGYWAWDADKSDFLWVSGFWRDTPPSRQYVPGYWTSTPEGWRWVQGFWAADQQDSASEPAHHGHDRLRNFWRCRAMLARVPYMMGFPAAPVGSVRTDRSLRRAVGSGEFCC